ncbi:MAG: hypothetical protein KAX18_04335 [Candidatus Lokiarchaeota archaeon]|nr:hypothetical protein [Candidatus Lokiarchaeota archaeon]
MEYNFYVYKKLECNLTINKMAIWFGETEFEGDENNGSIIFHSQNIYDEIWGPDSTLELNWEKKDRASLFYYKEVESSIETYNAIGIVVTKKERDWLMSHEFTTWFGQRRKMIRKRYYIEKVIHSIFFCEISERLINIHTSVIESMYDNFKPSLLKTFNSIECH